MAKEIAWHSLSLAEINRRLETDFKKGLEEKEALKRLKKFGKNVFSREERFYYLKLFWKQIKSPLVFILIIAGVVAFFLREHMNAIVIFLAVFINTSIGIFQEGKASQALKKLKSFQKKYAMVVRGGLRKLVESSEVAPGDIIILQMGDLVPADARLIEEKGLEVNESALTGEWMAVTKDMKKKIPPDAPLIERENMLWMGTLVTEGWAKAIVVNTGFRTEIGKIAEMVGKEEEAATPLQNGIKRVARFLGILTVLGLVVIFGVGLARGQSFTEMFLVAIALAVAAIPEGLPVAVTVVLALGMKKILAKGGLVKNLNAAETFGSTSVILTDKTGTLTKAEMVVSKIMTFLSEGREFKDKEHKDRLQVLQMAMLASGGFIENPDDELKEWVVRGRPMDKAILLASIEAGVSPKEIFKKYPRVDFIPFDSERRFSASMHKIGSPAERDKTRVYALGAPELILDFCDKIYKDGERIKMTDKERKIMERSREKETSRGIRMIAVAYRDGEWDSFPRGEEDKKVFSGMTFGGFIGFHDPLRADAAEAIKSVKDASLRTVMVTGDNVITAKKIAEEAGLLTKNGLVLEGGDIEKMSAEELKNIVERVDVFARVLPHQKMDIVRAWQARGAVVAMTGDGVNDAPSLKHADVGVALGSATEVAKEASDIILLNNSFSIIVAAIEEGRRILDNLKKTTAYLLSTGFSEIILVGAAIIAGMALPVLPTQILWTNIIEEGFMNFAFAFEPKEDNLMKRDPKGWSSKDLLSKNLRRLIIVISSITSVFLLILFFSISKAGYSLEEIRTIMFAGISIDSIFFAFSLKNFKKPIWKIHIFSNMYLVFSLILSIALLAAALFLAPLQKLLSIAPLSAFELLLVFSVGIFNLITIEAAKYFLFEKAGRWNKINKK